MIEHTSARVEEIKAGYQSTREERRAPIVKLQVEINDVVERIDTINKEAQRRKDEIQEAHYQKRVAFKEQ